MFKLIYKIRTRAAFADERFRFRLTPQEDELLSSWLTRVALEHRTMPATFTNLYLPETKNKLWASDIDLKADEQLLKNLSYKSMLGIEQLKAMTLKSYEGYLFERLYPKNGGTPFILPLAMRGRRSTLPGLRFCPMCLKNDERPYFRKKWRLSFSFACTEHKCFLCNKCMKCGTPVIPYKSCIAGVYPVCYKCKTKFSEMKAKALPANYNGLAALKSLYKTLDDGVVKLNTLPIYSYLYFIVLRQILRLIVSKRVGLKFRKVLGIKVYLDTEAVFPKVFDSLTMTEQAHIIWKAVWLLRSWPQRFLAVCNKMKLYSSDLVRDMCYVPFWYWRVIHDNLYKISHNPSDAEIRAVVEHLVLSKEK